MTKLTLPIQIGKKYIRRDGKVITAKEKNTAMCAGVLYVGTNDLAEGCGKTHCWVDTGRISSAGYATDNNALDLISDYVEVNNANSNAHPHAALMLEYAKDASESARPWENWEHKSVFNDMWLGCVLHPRWDNARMYRRKPVTIKINGIEVPKGLTEAPAYDTLVYICELEEVDYYYRMSWENRPDFKRAIERGIVHLSKENAQAMSKAMLSFE